MIKHTRGDLLNYGTFTYPKTQIKLYNRSRKYSGPRHPKSIFSHQDKVYFILTIKIYSMPSKSASATTFKEHLVDQIDFFCDELPKQDDYTATYNLKNKILAFKNQDFDGLSLGQAKNESAISYNNNPITLERALLQVFEHERPGGKFSNLFDTQVADNPNYINKVEQLFSDDLGGNPPEYTVKGLTEVKNITIEDKTGFHVIQMLCVIYGAYPYTLKTGGFCIRAKGKLSDEVLSSEYAEPENTVISTTYTSKFTFNQTNISKVEVDDGSKYIIQTVKITYGDQSNVIKKENVDTSLTTKKAYSVNLPMLLNAAMANDLAEKLLFHYGTPKRRFTLETIPCFFEPGQIVTLDLRKDNYKESSKRVGQFELNDDTLGEEGFGINEKLDLVVLECSYRPPFCITKLILEEL